MSSDRSATSPLAAKKSSMKKRADSPADVVRRMAGGFSTTQILNTAAKLSIADHLAKGSRSAAELAQDLSVHPQALHRFLRMMVVLELLTEDSNGTFGLSASGQLLRSDHPESLRDRIIYIGAINYPAAQAMLHSVQTGKPAFEHVFGVPFFSHFAQQPELGAIFNGLMNRNVRERIAGIIGAYDFSGMKTIVDIGGGNGALLATILDANPHAMGTLFDTPEVIAEARALLARSSVVQRIDMVDGDLFRGPLPMGGDIYLLSNIIHDWDDPHAKQILRHCRDAVRNDSRLLLIEEIMPAHAADSPATIANDFSMLLLTGGRERTKPEYLALLDATGFQLVSVIPFNLRSPDKRRNGNWAILKCKPK